MFILGSKGISKYKLLKSLKSPSKELQCCNLRYYYVRIMCIDSKSSKRDPLTNTGAPREGKVEHRNMYLYGTFYNFVSPLISIQKKKSAILWNNAQPMNICYKQIASNFSTGSDAEVCA